MLIPLLMFVFSLSVLLVAASYFTHAAEVLGQWLRFPAFVIGVFIVGIGTSLPELISGVLSVSKGFSEILPGNVMGANISNILLVTGLVAVLHRKNIHLSSSYIYIDLHFLLGSFFYFIIIAYDGVMAWQEAIFGLLIYLIYAIYLIKGEQPDPALPTEAPSRGAFPWKQLLLLVFTSAGIYFGAEYTIASLNDIALTLKVPQSIVALTLLSLGTTLPELAVNIGAIRRGKAEMAIGNVLGSCVFNTLTIAPIASFLGSIYVPDVLLQFSLPVMAACGLFFYLLTQDKKISVWEGLMLVSLYLLFLMKTVSTEMVH